MTPTAAGDLVHRHRRVALLGEQRAGDRERLLHPILAGEAGAAVGRREAIATKLPGYKFICE